MIITENDKYTVKPCEKCNVPEVMDFFGNQWSREHLLAASRDYVDYFFYNAKRGNYNIIISTDKQRGEVIGLLSYVPNNRFDPDIACSDRFVWLCNWLTAKDSYNGMGLSLYSGLTDYEGIKNLGTVGCNEETARLYRAMRFNVGILKHYFITNEAYSEFRILSNYTGSYGKGLEQADNYTLEPVMLDKFGCLGNISPELARSVQMTRPKKTPVYLWNKYAKNPYYKYLLYAVNKNGVIYAVFVLRMVEHENSRVLRIVDYIGRDENLAGLYFQFQKLCRDFDAEYIDFYCDGISENILTQSGFELCDGKGELTVPDYFEPFFKGNIIIRYAYPLDRSLVQEGNYRIFRGDCDRDFPRFTM